MAKVTISFYDDETLIASGIQSVEYEQHENGSIDVILEPWNDEILFDNPGLARDRNTNQNAPECATFEGVSSISICS